MTLSKLQKLKEIAFYYGKYCIMKCHLPSGDSNAHCRPFPLEYLKTEAFNQGLIASITDGNVLLFGKLYPLDGTNWNYDLEHKYDYGRRFYKLYKLASFEKNKDPKYVLELSRLNHVLYVWLFSKRNNDMQTLIWTYDQLKKWNKLNPIGIGMGWSCTMDVALRVINLVVIYSNDEEGYCKDLRGIIRKHHVFIRDNLENRGRINNNHYFTNLIGMIFTSIALGDKGAYEFAIGEIVKELELQILDDGGDFEGSITYHRYILQLMIYLIVILKSNEIEIPQVIIKKASLMLSFIRSVESNYKIPLFGDCDSSFVLNMDDYEKGDVRDIKSLLEIIANNLLLKDFNGNNIKLQYNQSGYYILKNPIWKAIIRCGSVRGSGGHYHNDQLSYVLYLDGEELFVDRGLYTYYGNYAIRNLCRSTVSHNCYALNGLEQNSITDTEIFLMGNEYAGEVLDVDEHCFDGKFSGYNNECMFNRKCRIKDKYFEEHSSFTKCGGELNYYLAPNCDVVALSPYSLKVTGATFTAIIESTEELKIIRELCFTAYMKAEQCNTIKVYPKAHEFELKIYKEKKEN